LDYQRLFLFVGSRVRAASLSPALIERADTKLAEFDAIEAELRVLDREEIVIRALLVNDNVVIDLGTGAVDRLAALADKRNATLNARRLLLGEKTVSEMNRPTGSGLSRQLDQLDQTLPNISQLPELPELQGLRAEVTQLQGANAVVR